MLPRTQVDTCTHTHTQIHKPTHTIKLAFSFIRVPCHPPPLLFQLNPSSSLHFHQNIADEVLSPINHSPALLHGTFINHTAHHAAAWLRACLTPTASSMGVEALSHTQTHTNNNSSHSIQMHCRHCRCSHTLTGLYIPGFAMIMGCGWTWGFHIYFLYAVIRGVDSKLNMVFWNT